MTPTIALYIYHAGILPTTVADAWYNAKHQISGNAPPAILAGLLWPLLFLVLGIIVPTFCAILWLFEWPACLGRWLARRP